MHSRALLASASSGFGFLTVRLYYGTFLILLLKAYHILAPIRIPPELFLDLIDDYEGVSNGFESRPFSLSKGPGKCSPLFKNL
jgi:hypothetical protein